MLAWNRESGEEILIGNDVRIGLSRFRLLEANTDIVALCPVGEFRHG